MNAHDHGDNSAAPLRPLSGDRYRTDEVERQIRWIQGMSPSEAQRRIAERDSAGAAVVKDEALVYLLRDYHRRGLAAEADRIAQALLERSAPRIARWVRGCLSSASAVHLEQCIEEVQTQTWMALLSDAPGNEFWEIAFLLCLKRRTMNGVDLFRKVAFAEVNPTITADSSGAEINILELLPDRGIEDVQSRIEMQEALNRLPADQRKALHLFYREQWSQQQIAQSFGVADRTIRNWLAAAIRSLRTYYGAAT